MRKILFMLTLLAVAVSATAQDVIVKKDGATIVCRVLGVNATEITYKKWTDQKGATYIIDRSLVARIDYEDGRQDNLSEQTSNVYAPGNQNSGAGRYNDNALLALDQSLHGKNNQISSPRAKKIAKIGGFVGGSSILVGSLLVISSLSWTYEHPAIVTQVSIGSVLIVGGLATTTGCLIRANNLKKQANSLTSAPILQHEFSLPNGNSLAAGVDMMHDGRFKTSNLGMGLKFSF